MLNNIDITNKGELARQQLLQAAVELFAEQGVAAASTRQIANRAGQNIAAIAYYFGSKEGLYMAVAEMIADMIKQHFSALSTVVEPFLSSGRCQNESDQCLSYIKQIIERHCEVLTRPETLSYSKILLREQLAPTAAFELIHERSLSVLHKMLTRLIAHYIGLPEDSAKATLHTHAIIGEVLAFRAGRETMLARMGWQEIHQPQFVQIKTVLFEHIDFILHGLREKQLHR